MGRWAFCARVLEPGTVLPRKAEIGPSIVDVRAPTASRSGPTSAPRARTRSAVKVEVIRPGGKVVFTTTARARRERGGRCARLAGWSLRGALHDPHLRRPSLCEPSALVQGGQPGQGPRSGCRCRQGRRLEAGGLHPQDARGDGRGSPGGQARRGPRESVVEDPLAAHGVRRADAGAEAARSGASARTASSASPTGTRSTARRSSAGPTCRRATIPPGSGRWSSSCTATTRPIPSTCAGGARTSAIADIDTEFSNHQRCHLHRAPRPGECRVPRHGGQRRRACHRRGQAALQRRRGSRVPDGRFHGRMGHLERRQPPSGSVRGDRAGVRRLGLPLP